MLAYCTRCLNILTTSSPWNFDSNLSSKPHWVESQIVLVHCRAKNFTLSFCWRCMSCLDFRPRMESFTWESRRQPVCDTHTRRTVMLCLLQRSMRVAQFFVQCPAEIAFGTWQQSECCLAQHVNNTKWLAKWLFSCCGHHLLFLRDPYPTFPKMVLRKIPSVKLIIYIILHHLVQEEPISSRRLEVKVLMDSRLLHCGTANTSDLPLGAKTWPTSWLTEAGPWRPWRPWPRHRFLFYSSWMPPARRSSRRIGWGCLKKMVQIPWFGLESLFTIDNRHNFGYPSFWENVIHHVFSCCSGKLSHFQPQVLRKPYIGMCQNLWGDESP